MPMVIFLVTCIAFIATEGQEIENCPTGSLTAVTATPDFYLKCVGYTGSATWKYSIGKSALQTMGSCGSSCQLLDDVFKTLYDLHEINDSASFMNTTAKFTNITDVITFECQGDFCSVTFGPPPTTQPTTDTRIENCPTGDLSFEKATPDFYLKCVGYTGPMTWKAEIGSFSVDMGTCDSTCQLADPASSSLFTLTAIDSSSSFMNATANYTVNATITFECDGQFCRVTFGSDSGLPSWQIVIIVLAGIIVVGVIIGTIILWWKCYDKENGWKCLKNGKPDHGNGTGNDTDANNSKPDHGNGNGNNTDANNRTSEHLQPTSNGSADGGSRPLPMPNRQRAAHGGPTSVEKESNAAPGKRDLPMPNSIELTNHTPRTLAPLDAPAGSPLTSVERNSYAGPTKQPLPSIPTNQRH